MYRKLARQLSRTNSLAVVADYKLVRSKKFLRHRCYVDRHHKLAWQWGCRVAAVSGLSLFVAARLAPVWRNKSVNDLLDLQNKIQMPDQVSSACEISFLVPYSHTHLAGSVGYHALNVRLIGGASFAEHGVPSFALAAYSNLKPVRTTG